MDSLVKKHNIKSFSIFELASVENTMNYAKEFLRDKEAVFTKNQFKARGKGGRNWEVKEGNFYLSITLIPANKKFEELPQLSFVTAIALRDSMIELSKKFNVNLDIKCKWPNDILVNGKKISGILLESKLNPQNTGLEKLIIGVGVNVIFSPENINTIYNCTNLRSEGIDIDSTNLMQLFFQHFDKYYTEWTNYGFRGIRNEWLKNAYNLNKEIVIKDADGNEINRGILSDLDVDGDIILKLSNGQLINVCSGDVFGTHYRKNT